MAVVCCTSYNWRRQAGFPSDKEGIAWSGSLTHPTTIHYVISSRKCKRQLKIRVMSRPKMVTELRADLALGRRAFCTPKWRRTGKNLARGRPELAAKFPSQNS